MDDLTLALTLADAADAVTMPLFRRDPSQRRKSDGTIVTEADEGAERAMRELLGAHRGDDGILGEEEGYSPGSGTRRWILDPIDGTKSYSWGIPLWGTLIALEQDGEIVVGVASLPAIGERYAAARGRGATCNGEPIHVSTTSTLGDARVSHGVGTLFKAGTLDALRTSCFEARGYTDLWPHLLVASGRLDVMADPTLSPWDIAALVVIVEEAGGRLTNFAGERRIDGGSALTTNGRLHDVVLPLIRT